MKPVESTITCCFTATNVEEESITLKPKLHKLRKLSFVQAIGEMFIIKEVGQGSAKTDLLTSKARDTFFLQTQDKISKGEATSDERYEKLAELRGWFREASNDHSEFQGKISEE